MIRAEEVNDFDGSSRRSVGGQVQNAHLNREKATCNGQQKTL